MWENKICNKSFLVTSATDHKMVWDEFISTLSFILMACSGVDRGFSRGGELIFKKILKSCQLKY